MGPRRKIYVCDTNGLATELASRLMEHSTPFRVMPMPFDVFEFEIKEEIWTWLSVHGHFYGVEQSPALWEPKDDQ